MRKLLQAAHSRLAGGMGMMVGILARTHTSTSNLENIGNFAADDTISS